MCKDKREAGSMRLRIHRVYKKMDRRRKIELFDRIAHKVSKGVYDSVLNERNGQPRVKATNIFFKLSKNASSTYLVKSFNRHWVIYTRVFLHSPRKLPFVSIVYVGPVNSSVRMENVNEIDGVIAAFIRNELPQNTCLFSLDTRGECDCKFRRFSRVLNGIRMRNEVKNMLLFQKHLFSKYSTINSWHNGRTSFLSTYQDTFDGEMISIYRIPHLKIHIKYDTARETIEKKTEYLLK